MTLHHSGRLADAVSAIEREIASMWAPEPGAPPKTRASTANLIVVSGSTHIELARTLAETLATAEVARTMVVSVDAKIPPWAVEASVSARCRVDGAGEICSERIDLTLGASVMSRAASVISSLCVTEVPTSVLAIFPTPTALLSSLLKLGDHLVVDSDATSIELSSELAQESRARLHDLAWERLLPWRNHLATCFDDLRARRSVTAIRKLTLRTTPTEGGQTSPSVRWLLGWLSSRLGWRFTSPTSAIDALNLPVKIELEWRRAELPPGELIEVELEADATDIPLRLSLIREPSSDSSPDRWLMHSTREGEEIGVEDRRFRVQRLATTALVDRAVHDPSSDAVLRSALQRAVSYPPATKRTQLDDQSQPG
ncbi:MAG: glucose-6-phosphate dehydrogenase assembly protein OpcA [Polyangiaceae bacterium]